MARAQPGMPINVMIEIRRVVIDTSEQRRKDEPTTYDGKEEVSGVHYLRLTMSISLKATYRMPFITQTLFLR